MALICNSKKSKHNGFIRKGCEMHFALCKYDINHHGPASEAKGLAIIIKIHKTDLIRRWLNDIYEIALEI